MGRARGSRVREDSPRANKRCAVRHVTKKVFGRLADPSRRRWHPITRWTARGKLRRPRRSPALERIAGRAHRDPIVRPIITCDDRAAPPMACDCDGATDDGVEAREDILLAKRSNGDREIASAALLTLSRSLCKATFTLSRETRDKLRRSQAEMSPAS